VSGKLKRNIMIGVAVLAVLAGGIVAIVTASGSGEAPVTQAHRTDARRAHARVEGDLALAASYLGITRPQLRHDLRSGSSLADVANTTRERSASGLFGALYAARAARLSSGESAGKHGASGGRSRCEPLVRVCSR
jgi:hypothetical protein